MVYPSGMVDAQQRIAEILSRLNALENRAQGPTPELNQAETQAFGRILSDQIEPSSNANPQMSDILGIIEGEASKNGLDPNLVKAVVKAESGFNPQAVSPAGAKGLMQLMPSTAQELGVRSILDPEDNVAGGAKYLRQLLDKYHSVPNALAAYNAGPGTVDNYGGIPPYKETQQYVQRVLNFHNGYSRQTNME